MTKKKSRYKRPSKAEDTSTTDGRIKSAATKKSTKKVQGTDPERLALSKNDILEFCDRVLKRWQQDPVPNSRNIAAMIAVRTGVLFSDEVSLQAIWSEIISWVYQMLYENAQAQARQENQEWADTFAKIKK